MGASGKGVKKPPPEWWLEAGRGGAEGIKGGSVDDFFKLTDNQRHQIQRAKVRNKQRSDASAETRRTETAGEKDVRLQAQLDANRAYVAGRSAEVVRDQLDKFNVRRQQWADAHPEEFAAKLREVRERRAALRIASQDTCIQWARANLDGAFVKEMTADFSDEDAWKMWYKFINSTDEAIVGRLPGHHTFAKAFGLPTKPGGETTTPTVEAAVYPGMLKVACFPTSDGTLARSV